MIFTDARFVSFAGPNSGFGSCMHWTQLLNPKLNPSARNMHATCMDCPYVDDVDPDGNAQFRGLLYGGGQTHLLDGDVDGVRWLFRSLKEMSKN
jgi:hypothetical protein